MRTRQKTMLAVLLQSPTRPTRTQLTKWLFLLRQESYLRNDPTFYDFLPYRYGPFSFTAYRDIMALARNGFLEPEQLSIRGDQTNNVQRIVGTLPLKVKRAIDDILTKYGALSNQALVQVVYTRYPWYASQREPRQTSNSAHLAPFAIYTIGYEGKSVDLFLSELLRVGIQRVVDVRRNPTSRKYGFSKTSLARLTQKVGIEYISFPHLGIDGALRTGFKNMAEYQPLLDYYEREILPEQSQAVEQVSRLLHEKPSVLMCFEADVRCCHRERLARTLAHLTGLQLVHL